MQQSIVQDQKTIRFGSAVFEVGDSIGTLVNLGAIRDVTFEESMDIAVIKSDNCGEVRRRVKEHRAAVSGNLMEINLANLALLRGGIDTYSVQNASPVSVTDEVITLTGTKLVRLANKNADGSEVSSIVVTDASGATTYTRDTHYVVAVDSAGYTCIARTTGSTIPDGATVKVDYQYTPASAKILKSGGKISISPRVVRVTNYDENGKMFRITVYKAMNAEGIKIDFPADDDEDSWVIPIKLEGSVDTTRTVGDQLFEIYDEQSA